MRFSVVIPLYNKAAHIADTLHSVLAQQYEDFEIIVVDDGSTDDSAALVEAFESEGVRLIRKENGGTATARNAGIRLSEGDYICFLDGDDLWKPNFLKTIAGLIARFPQAGLYCTAYEFQRKGKRYHPGYHGLPEQEQELLVPDYFESVLYGEQVATASSSCIPRRVFNELGLFNEEIRYTEDQEMWNRVVLKYPVAFSKKQCAVYRQDAQNMKTSRVPKQEIPYADCLQQQLDRGEVPEDKIAAARKIVAANLIGAASLNLLAGDKKTARRFLNDPRSEAMPERKAAWQRLLHLPPILLRNLFRLRRKLKNRR